MKLSDVDIECLKEAKALIDKDISRHYTIYALARTVGLSESKLTRGFKTVYKMGVFAYLENERMERGKYLVDNTDKPVKEISRLVGYRYRGSFSVAFKKKFGVTPGGRRKLADQL